MQQLPFLLMGAVTLAAASLCIWLPETRGSPQPESLEQLEDSSQRTLLADLVRASGRRRQQRLQKVKRQQQPAGGCGAACSPDDGDDGSDATEGGRASCGVRRTEGTLLEKGSKRPQSSVGGGDVTCRTAAVHVAVVVEEGGSCCAPNAGTRPPGYLEGDEVPLLGGSGARDPLGRGR